VKFLLFTTCVCNAENLDDLERLLNCFNSVSSSVFIEHIVLLQNINEFNRDLNEVVSNPNYELRLVKIEGVISLAKARNLMISFSMENNLFSDSDYISFPDDDCWFLSSYWDCFLELNRKVSFDLFYSNFSSKPVSFCEEFNTHSMSNLIRNSSSITTFYSRELFLQIGLFDERFGVGSQNNGGEDTDFAIRGCLISIEPYYSNRNLVGHKDPLRENKPIYYSGSLGVLNKHKLKSMPLFYNYLRKLLIGCAYFFIGKLTLSEFKTFK
jgi:hypothetical protein